MLLRTEISFKNRRFEADKAKKYRGRQYFYLPEQFWKTNTGLYGT
jgi:hypothetical protein